MKSNITDAQKPFLPLRQTVAERAAKSRPADPMRDAARLYEKQFLREMVKQMRKTVNSSGLIKQNMAEKIFQEQLDNEYVEIWGDRGGIGLSDIIYEQLNERFGNGSGPMLKRGMMPVEKGTVKKVIPLEKGVQMNLEARPPEGKAQNGAEVRVPLEGRVDSTFSLDDGNKVVSLSHPGGLQSQIFFSGGLSDLQLGEQVAAGHHIGFAGGVSSPLIWKIIDKG